MKPVNFRGFKSKNQNGLGKMADKEKVHEIQMAIEEPQHSVIKDRHKVNRKTKKIVFEPHYCIQIQHVEES